MQKHEGNRRTTFELEQPGPVSITSLFMAKLNYYSDALQWPHKNTTAVQKDNLTRWSAARETSNNKMKTSQLRQNFKSTIVT